MENIEEIKKVNGCDDVANDLYDVVEYILSIQNKTID